MSETTTIPETNDLWAVVHVFAGGKLVIDSYRVKGYSVVSEDIDSFNSDVILLSRSGTLRSLREIEGSFEKLSTQRNNGKYDDSPEVEIVPGHKLRSLPFDPTMPIDWPDPFTVKQYVLSQLTMTGVEKGRIWLDNDLVTKCYDVTDNGTGTVWDVLTQDAFERGAA